MSFEGKRLVVVGGGSGIARRIAADADAAGAEVTLAGRTPAEIGGPGLRTAFADLGDEASLKALAEAVGELDYLVTLGAAPANGPVADLDRDAVTRAFDAKVIGPLLLAKHFAPRFRDGGAMALFSGVAAWRPVPGRTVMATTNGAVAVLAEALAVELAPIRVTAISPGIVDSGAWDRLGEGKDEFFRRAAETNPARRVGTTADVAAATLQALANPFVTGTVLHVDGGARLA
ncbi:SDR family oxidoreductase [Amycolatopsis australiensis]|uniref:NAD(P)-dependent dehydrogenase, short-chain alcohol dehydrogenase family n=1 Tax=Amycolatopsis australiensis TaxID=546364 RepID=A0A1K1R9F8_9PSEU|nr:SDR family oxidoreductase [Amycolatopsis australiensis]SFW68677.1 NAD(P)-dependent dehydrogenase, short-chain alcohol dehydrogenase family [Amycolatopsis australiensis]